MSRRIDKLLGRGREAPAVERPVVAYAKKRGMLAVKLSFIGLRGAPDRMFIGKNGTLFFMEFKRAGGRVPAYQTRIHQLLQERGFNVHVVFTKKEGIEAVDSYTA